MPRDAIAIAAGEASACKWFVNVDVSAPRPVGEMLTE
jgi:hypothetical protein